MSFKIDKLEEKRRDLTEKIEQCNLQKQIVKRTIQKLTTQYNIGEIHFQEYQKRYKAVFKDKTPEQWVNYYNIQLKTYKAQLDWYEQEIRKASKTQKPESNQQKISERIKAAEKYKEHVISSVQDLAERYTAKEINYQQYQENLRIKFREKTPQQWVDYYDNYIKGCKSSLTGYEKKSKLKKTSLIAAP
ncbi:MAG: hypothetical protein ABIH92_02000, partial [Nanoarchaeota archaeon]